MTVTFDLIWIPTALSVLAIVWASLIFADVERAMDDLFFAISVGVVWPMLPVLSAWLVWALLT